ncbi:hypothetical protein JCM17380_25440 [Desulfosporosinus burensis]
MLHYFQTFRARIGELIAQKVPMEEAEKHLQLPEFENWEKKNWLPISVKKIYSELAD